MHIPLLHVSVILNLHKRCTSLQGQYQRETLFVVVCVNWATNRTRQTKLVDRRKVTNRTRQTKLVDRRKVTNRTRQTKLVDRRKVTNRTRQTKLVDRRKVTQLNLLCQKVLMNTTSGAGIAQLVVLGLAVHSVAGSILLWGHFPVEGIFPLELTWVQTPFPPKFFRMRV